MYFKYLMKFYIFLFILSLTNCSILLGPELGSDNTSVFDYFWDTFDKKYSYFIHKGINWDDVRDEYRDHAIEANSDEELFDILCEMISPLNDSHVWIDNNDWRFNSTGSNFNKPKDNNWYHTFWYSQIDTEKYTGSLQKTKSEIISFGKVIDRNIGYLHISSMREDLSGHTTVESWVKEIDPVIDSFMDTEALIIDVRGNSGGFMGNAKYIASRFITEKTMFARTKVRVGENHDDFGPFVNYYVEPRGSIYPNKVYIITNGNTVSAGELFVLMMKQADNVIHIGSNTKGATGMVLFHELPNGWSFSTTIGYTTDIYGICYEEIGITPDFSPEFLDYDDSCLKWILQN